jgi:hypothetical protein
VEEGVRRVMSPEVLLSGLFGALLVFLLGVLREWWRNEQERRGLLILLLTEISHNGEVIRTVQDRINPDQAMEDLIGHPHFSTQKVRTWDNVQERAAALLPDDLMAALDEYYAPLETLLTLVRFPNMASDSFDRTLRGEIQEMKPAWSVAATRQPYREQLQKLLDAQESTPAKIEEYLAQPRWGPLFLRADQWARHQGRTP